MQLFAEREVTNCILDWAQQAAPAQNPSISVMPVGFAAFIAPAKRADKIKPRVFSTLKK
jgi:hypothetical protein